MDNNTTPSNTGLSEEQKKAMLRLANSPLGKNSGIDLQQVLLDTGVIKSPADNILKDFISVSPLIEKLKDDVRKVCIRDEPVLIRGETGTGKELIAKALHQPRINKGRFIPCNITTLPSELIESELFGHMRGSFTGAQDTKQGLFEIAGEGTIFLDEIGEMPANAQAKLLRVLQERRIRRVGDVNEMEVKCRVVCATHCNLEEMVSDGKFREDLYWRLNMIELIIPPLRERKDDIQEIIDHKFKDDAIKIPQTIIDKWSGMPLRGNVRELESRCLKYILFGKE
jgi:transcriptional regulator with GAF, ATPase, and Fis domain